MMENATDSVWYYLACRTTNERVSSIRATGHRKIRWKEIKRLIKYRGMPLSMKQETYACHNGPTWYCSHSVRNNDGALTRIVI